MVRGGMPFVLTLGALLGCKPKDRGSPVAAPSASASVGLISVTVDHSTLLAAAPSGFEACRGDMGPALERHAGDAALEAFRKSPPRPTLPVLAARATHDKAALVVTTARPPPRRVPLGDWANVVHTSPEAVATQHRSGNEWDSHYGDLLNAILPTGAFVAFAGKEDWRESSVYSDLAVRIYAIDEEVETVARALARDGARVLEVLACAQREGPMHRDAWRVEISERAQARRVRLSASLFYGDYGDIAHVDLRILPLGSHGTLVLACMYAGEFHEKSCNVLAL